MKAFVYHGPDQASWDTVPDPEPQDQADVIVQVEATALCGTDLHILSGGVPEVRPGTVLGHEAVGTVVEAGRGVRTVKPGDRVIVSCVSPCGRCRYCREGAYGQCQQGGGWVLGHLINGTQAEFVRVPFADLAVHPLPSAIKGTEAVLLSDILPTAYEVGALNGRVRPGDTAVVVGAGPIGLATIVMAKLFSPARIIALEPVTSRLEAASQLGADVVAGPTEDPESLVNELTDGQGADVVFEAVGRPETFELCTRLVRPGGRLANLGVHTGPASLALDELWHKDITLTTGLVDTSSTPRLLAMLHAGRLPVSSLVTHTFPLDDIAEAYEIFSRPAETAALKVVLEAHPGATRAIVPTS